MDKLLQLKITLRDSKPPIWRRILVKENINFHKLHEIIQVVMGWQNYHLYDFIVNDQRFSLPNHDFEEDVLSSKKFKLSILNEKQKMDYTYDFGDCWEHNIIVEKVLSSDTGFLYPICLKGSLSTPPEDCGGISGYYHLLQVKNNKDHPHYKEQIANWLGEDFNPKFFDLQTINNQLKREFS